MPNQGMPMNILGSLMGGQQGGMPPMPSFQPDANSPMAQMMGGQQETPQGQPQMLPENMPEALQPGKTGDSTKPLLMAISALHGYIAASTDPGEVALIRKVVSLLTNLIQRDQEKSTAMMQQQIQQPQAPQPTMGGPQNG